MKKEKVKCMYYISKEVVNKLDEIAEEYGFVKSILVEKAIKEYIKNHIDKE